MKKFALVLLAGMSGVAVAQGIGGGAAVPAGTAVEPAKVYDTALSNAEGSMMSLVKAMPADKYGFVPSAAIFVAGQKTDFTGVRTFGALVIHVAQANYGLGGRMSGLKPDVDVASLAKLKDKEEVVAALAASFAFVHKAMGTITAENAFKTVAGPMTPVSVASLELVHIGDEYGQMVEYGRMNGIVPPASEKK